jgi:hypothetical protein
MRDEKTIQDMADNASDAAYKPSKYSGMSYEEGIRDALDWVLDETIPSPLEDEP